MGGMAAQIPIKNDDKANNAALEKVGLLRHHSHAMQGCLGALNRNPALWEELCWREWSCAALMPVHKGGGAAFLPVSKLAKVGGATGDSCHAHPKRSAVLL